MRSLQRAAGCAVVLVSVSACTRVVDGVPPLADPPSRTTATATAGPTAASGQPNGLSGFGAAKVTFGASHAEVSSSSPGCCYAPIVRYDDGMPIPTWNVANSPGEVVTFLIHNFALATDEATATRRVQVEDLPSDARVIKSAVIDGGACRFTVYRSAKLGRALNTDTFSVRLYSPAPTGAAPRYVSTSIEQAKIIANDVDICTI